MNPTRALSIYKINKNKKLFETKIFTHTLFIYFIERMKKYFIAITVLTMTLKSRMKNTVSYFLIID